LRALSTFDVPDVADDRGFGTRKPYRKRVAIKRHEFLRKPSAAVATSPAASSLEVSCEARIGAAVETSASSSSLLAFFASGSARDTAPDRADAPPAMSVTAAPLRATLTTPYAVLLEAA
jgi:hypothetical protein